MLSLAVCACGMTALRGGKAPGPETSDPAAADDMAAIYGCEAVRQPAARVARPPSPRPPRVRHPRISTHAALMHGDVCAAVHVATRASSRAPLRPQRAARPQRSESQRHAVLESAGTPAVMWPRYHRDRRQRRVPPRREASPLPIREHTHARGVVTWPGAQGFEREWHGLCEDITAALHRSDAWVHLWEEYYGCDLPEN